MPKYERKRKFTKTKGYLKFQVNKNFSRYKKMLIKFISTTASLSLLLAAQVPIISPKFQCDTGKCARSTSASASFLGKIKTNGQCGSSNARTLWVNLDYQVKLASQSVCWQVVGNKIKTKACNSGVSAQLFDLDANNNIILKRVTNGKCVNSQGNRLKYNSGNCKTGCTPSTLWNCPGACHDCKNVEFIDHCDMDNTQKAECTNVQFGQLNQCFTWKCKNGYIPDSDDFNDNSSGEKVFVCRNNGGTWSSFYSMMGEYRVFLLR